MPDFVDFYRKAKRLPNITLLVLTGVSSDIGRKGNHVSCKRKKGEITSRVQMSSRTSLATKLVTPEVASIPLLQQDQSTVYSQPIGTCTLPNSLTVLLTVMVVTITILLLTDTVCDIQATGFSVLTGGLF